MKRQLRPGDMLARLGGDEFAVLVPAVRNRADVEEIAMRLERCFDEPFAIEECLARFGQRRHRPLPRRRSHQGQPADAADAAMYEAKNARKARIHARPLAGCRIRYREDRQ